MDQKTFFVVLDDEPEIAELIGNIASGEGFETAVTTSASRFKETLKHRAADLIALDLQMPGTDGIEILRYLANQRVRAGIVLITGMDERTIASAESFGHSKGLNVIGALQKPFTPDELIELLAMAQLSTRTLTADDLQRAIENEELIVYYQPTVQRFADGTWDVATMEALVRWKHPARGILAPDEFLQIGEDNGLSGAITDFVIQRGIEQLKGWQALNLRLGLRINIAATLISDIDFPDRLEATLLEQNIDPADLTLEITETAMLDQRPDTADILTRLRVKNINLAIDDFGIGYSSLTQLFSMPFNEMKIDKSLVLRVTKSREAQIMVEALVELAHKLGLSVCSEGVETEEALAFLNNVQCDSAQGYYISRPVPANKVPTFVQGWNQRQRDELQPGVAVPGT